MHMRLKLEEEEEEEEDHGKMEDGCECDVGHFQLPNVAIRSYTGGRRRG